MGMSRGGGLTCTGERRESTIVTEVRARPAGGAARPAGRTRLALWARLVLATGGAYLVCYSVTGALAVLLPLHPHESVTAAGLMTPLVAACAVLFAVSARSLTAAAVGMGGIAASALAVTVLAGL